MATWLWPTLLMTNTFCFTQVFRQFSFSACVSYDKQYSDNASEIGWANTRGVNISQCCVTCLHKNFKICYVFHPHLDTQNIQILSQNLDKKEKSFKWAIDNNSNHFSG